MKKLLIVWVLLFALLGSGPLFAGSWSPWSFQSELDLYLGVKAGAEYQFSDLFGVRGTAGVCIISPTQISYTLVGVAHLLTPESQFQCEIQFGLVQCIFDVLGQYVYSIPSLQNAYTYWMPGVCVGLGYHSPSGHGIALRLGGGVRFGYDLGAWQGPQLGPDLAVEYSFHGK